MGVLISFPFLSVSSYSIRRNFRPHLSIKLLLFLVPPPTTLCMISLLYNITPRCKKQWSLFRCDSTSRQKVYMWSYDLHDLYGTYCAYYCALVPRNLCPLRYTNPLSSRYSSTLPSKCCAWVL